MDKLAVKLEVDFKAYSKEFKPYLSTEELKELTRKGFGISSHSWDHPKYGDLSLKEQMETTGKTFAYLKRKRLPVTKLLHFLLPILK
ncbi:hypothetical protein BOQ60_23805 [Chryseobacterium sp. CH1]|nr:hypothetical protein BOQ60_23805 [Chryseobacterium sp. CH1]